MALLTSRTTQISRMTRLSHPSPSVALPLIINSVNPFPLILPSSPKFSNQRHSSTCSLKKIKHLTPLIIPISAFGSSMGALDHISELFDCSSGSSKHKKRKQLQTVEVKVKMDCEGCERKVKKAVEGMKGVNQVDIDRKANKVTVTGYVDQSKVVARIAHRTGKKAELWPYVPYDVVAHPYAPGVYDKKAPAGYVRSAEDPYVNQLARASSTEVRYTTAFSDENPTACAVM